MTLTVGSLCSGYGGLERGLSMVVPTRLAWVSEVEPAPCAVLDARYGVPNLGDITAVDWSTVEPVDVLTAGFPCQDLSYAGKGAGLEGERSGLWFDVLACVRGLRPRWVVVENVGALVNRGLDVVTHGLAESGYVGTWACVRASDVGACHRRERVFLVAADAEHHGLNGATVGRSSGEGTDQRWMLQLEGRTAEVAADADSPRPQGRGAVRGGGGERAAGPGGVGAAADAARSEQQSEPSGANGGRPLVGAVAGTGARTGTRDTPAGVPFVGRGEGVAWGSYAPAIARHEAVLGRPAPRPVDDGGRLSPHFVEWMMMLPEGWVTDIVPARTAALKALGNGVVPLQAAHAIAGLLGRLSGAQERRGGQVVDVGPLLPTPSATYSHEQDPEVLLPRRERVKAEHNNGNGFGLSLGMAVKLLDRKESA